MTQQLDIDQTILTFLHALIDQQKARIIIHPNVPQSGYWFGGGNLVQDSDGSLWLSGRYRNGGDSRTGLEAGTRGLECALFRSTDGGDTFEKVQSFSKADLSQPDAEVLSIEGTALHRQPDGSWEWFISSEKARAYPAGFEAYQKPGTGVWSIDRVTGAALGAFSADTLETVLINNDKPEYLHIKDPVLFDDKKRRDGAAVLFASLSWASSNTGYARRRPGEAVFKPISWQAVERGPAWDVAVTRVTNRLVLPQLGQLADMPLLAVYFYDGAESLRPLDPNPRGFQRPRGYSCEEIGGALLGVADYFPSMWRLSLTAPLFVSPYGTGSSRYVSTLVTDEYLYAIWQQSQADGSQPLVMNRLAMDEVRRLLV